MGRFKKKAGRKKILQLRSYRQYKQQFKCEDYLHACTNISHRRSFTRLRLSCHKLEIEVGRYNNVDVVDRICKYCNLNQCEDEEHFLIQCDLYKTPREILFIYIIKIFPSFNKLNNHQKFVFLMSTNDKMLVNKIAMFINECLDTRSAHCTNSGSNITLIGNCI